MPATVNPTDMIEVQLVLDAIHTVDQKYCCHDNPSLVLDDLVDLLDLRKEFDESYKVVHR